MAEYVLKKGAVRSAFWRLVEEPIHANFPGYLAALWLAEENGTTSNLRWGTPTYEPFFERFFRVAGGSGNYLKPFCGDVENPDVDSKLWFGSNLPGTYGLGHIGSRSVLSEMIIVENTGHNGELSLRDDHSQRAEEHLLDHRPVSAKDVALYLYRDFVFESDTDPDVDDLIDKFRTEFGFEDDGEDFDRLFTVEDTTNGVFEEYDA